MTLLYVIVNGIFFAVLQSGYFFALGTAYLGTFWGLTFFAYDIRFLPLCGAMVALSGLYAGAFFRVNRTLLGTASRLFFWENNGFIAGWIIGFFCFVYGGGPLLLWMPGILGAGILLLGFLLPHHPSGSGFGN